MGLYSVTTSVSIIGPLLYLCLACGETVWVQTITMPLRESSEGVSTDVSMVWTGVGGVQKFQLLRNIF